MNGLKLLVGSCVVCVACSQGARLLDEAQGGRFGAVLQAAEPPDALAEAAPAALEWQRDRTQTNEACELVTVAAPDGSGVGVEIEALVFPTPGWSPFALAVHSRVMVTDSTTAGEFSRIDDGVQFRHGAVITPCPTDRQSVTLYLEQ